MVKLLIPLALLGFLVGAPWSGLPAIDPGYFTTVAIENGDANGDWALDVSDGISIFHHLFLGGPAPVPIACGRDVPDKQNCDVNGDGALDISDGVSLLGYLFIGTSHPVDICSEGPGSGAAVQRSIEEFVAAQDTFCILPPEGGSCTDIGAQPDPAGGPCCLWVPPVKNFFGWTDPFGGYSTAIDYAGLANEWITGASGGAVTFGTTFSGSVTERTLKDGRAEVSVRLHTKNALAWAFENGPPFGEAPLVFGHRAPEVLNEGAEPALAECLLHVVFIQPAPGLPLPDLMQVFNGPVPGQEALTLSFNARAEGPLRELFGVPEGTAGKLECTQVGLLNISAIANPNSRVAQDGFPAEHVKIWAAGAN
jgi:hypothetical protein